MSAKLINKSNFCSNYHSFKKKKLENFYNEIEQEINYANILKKIRKHVGVEVKTIKSSLITCW